MSNTSKKVLDKNPFFFLVNLFSANLIFEAFWASKFSQPLETNSILCCKIEKWPACNQLCWQKLLQKKKVFNVLSPFVEQHQVCFCKNQIHSFILWNWLLLIQGGRKLYISTRHPNTALLSWPGVMKQALSLKRSVHDPYLSLANTYRYKVCCLFVICLIWGLASLAILYVHMGAWVVIPSDPKVSDYCCRKNLHNMHANFNILNFRAKWRGPYMTTPDLK